ncbi:MAG: glycyl-radical enzyme activating protein [Christensenellales bacterium]|jgi:glycyl-radical enzyme activating protein
MTKVNENKIVGLIADIQRYSLHDGPGIRTSVFLKGCNMRCVWCHNPEMISTKKEVLLDSSKCIHCGKCKEGCFSGARRVVGQTMTPQEVLSQVLLDRSYYSETGGMTITGGEPSVQAVFSERLLHLAKKENINCAMESNLLAPWEILLPLIEKLDYLMCDLKVWDNEIHKKWTGVNNDQIISNIKLASQMHIPMVVRVPIVVDVNDSETNMQMTAKFIASLNNEIILELLPYHSLGLSKKIVSDIFVPHKFETPSKEKMLDLANIAIKYELNVRIAGVNQK